MNAEWVVGFSLRSGDHNALTRAWDTERRVRYLLRQDITFSLSFDELVWPKCGSAELWNKCFLEPVCASSDRDGCEFVEDLMSIRDPRSVPHECELTQDCCLVAFIAPTHLRLLQESSMTIARAIEEKRNSIPSLGEWRSLGFDVVESCLGLSGLSNTAFSEDERRSLSSMFASDINSLGLLESSEVALRFAAETNHRVAEHAPFVPVALAALRCPL